MTNLRKSWSLAAFLLALFGLLAPTASAQPAATLTVFAAASLTDAFEAVALSFEGANPNVDVVYNFGSSSTLATQLVEGAPADVFASANNIQMDVVREAGRIDAAPRIFAQNRLVLIVPADNPAAVQSLQDLANPGLLLVLAAPGVPIREYTNTMLERLAADPAYGESYREAVLANVVSEEDNVRQVAAKVALGEADAGIVYVSDVTPDIRDQVLTLDIPDELNTIATYPIAPLSDTAYPELAATYIDFLLSPDGQAILETWGFIGISQPELPPVVTLSSAADVVTVDGQVNNPLMLDVAALQAFTPYTRDVTLPDAGDGVTVTFTGALLWDVLNAAEPNLNPNQPSDELSLYLVISTTDGKQVVISWGEIDPDFGDAPILLAYAENGTPIIDDEGAIRLIVPTDSSDGRSVSGVRNISLRDAPMIAP